MGERERARAGVVNNEYKTIKIRYRNYDIENHLKPIVLK